MKTKNSLNLFVFLFIFTVISACRQADRSSMEQPDSAKVGNDSLRMKDSLNASNDVTMKSKVDGDGAAFIDSAAIGGMVEVDLAKLAIEKSTNLKVKEFAAKMVADHTKINADLKAIATKLKHLLPEAYPADVKLHIEAMKKLKGKEFDTHYMGMMVDDHEKTLKLFNSASSLNAGIKDFAARTLPVLEKHYQTAKEIHASLK